MVVLDDEETDYDTDDDGLIEVDSLAKLNAVRYDLDGDGVADTVYESDGSTVDAAATAANQAGYAIGFSAPASGQCDDGGTSETETCSGYELTENLDFDTDGNGDTDGNDSGGAYWHSGAGWAPIGVFSDDGNASNDLAFTGVFEGNGNTLSNLFINRSTTDYAGLFGHVFGEVRNVGLVAADVTGRNNVGALVGWNEARTVTGAWVSGSVSGVGNVGGLVGQNHGSVTVSYSTADVTGTGGDVGGLVGYNGEFGAVEDAWASGAVSGGSNGDNVGGLVGANVGTVQASYSTGAVSGDRRVGALIGALEDTIDGEQVSGYLFDSYADRDTSGVLRAVGDSFNMVVETCALVTETDGAGREVTRPVCTFRERPILALRTTAQLQSPTGYTGIYSDWDIEAGAAGAAHDVWDFGTEHNYPVLKGVGGVQRRPSPTGLGAVRTTENLTISWAAPAGVTPSGYWYRVSDDGGATWGNWTRTTGTEHVIASPGDSSYAFEVRIDAAAAHARDGIARLGPPGTPTGLELTAGDRHIDAEWTAPADDGGSAVSGYSLQHRVGAAGEYTTVAVGNAATSAEITGLANGTRYRVRVAAVNAMGTGAYSGQEILRAGSTLPEISIEGGLALEGDPAVFTVTSSLDAPSGGLAVTVNVSGGGSFVAAGERGDKTVTIPAGQTSATLSVPTIDSTSGTAATANAAVTAEVRTGTGYTVHATAADATHTVVHRAATTDATTYPTVGRLTASRRAGFGQQRDPSGLDRARRQRSCRCGVPRPGRHQLGVQHQPREPPVQHDARLERPEFPLLPGASGLRRRRRCLDATPGGDTGLGSGPRHTRRAHGHPGGQRRVGRGMDRAR